MLMAKLLTVPCLATTTGKRGEETTPSKTSWVFMVDLVRPSVWDRNTRPAFCVFQTIHNMQYPNFIQLRDSMFNLRELSKY